jgi:hypothetical protein
MTRLTNELRNYIRSKIMKGLPMIDYRAHIEEFVQSTVIEFAPTEVQEMYKTDKGKMYLREYDVCISDPAGTRRDIYIYRIYGLHRSIRVRLDPRAIDVLKEGTLEHTLHVGLIKNQLCHKLVEQEQLRNNVNDRLTANLAAASTIKKLYTVLEPELHGYIPVDVPVENLPATVAPVVDDLRKLGANLPIVAKAEIKEVQSNLEG